MVIPLKIILKEIKREAKQIELPSKIRCPQCKKLVIKKELSKNGCYVCGFKPERTKPKIPGTNGNSG